MIRKKFLLGIIFLFFISFAFSEEENLAKFYITKAFEYYKSGQLATSKDLLKKSFAYSKIYPEYYYINNLLLDEKRDNNHIKKEYADKIVVYMNNLFLVEEYDFIKQVSKIYEDVKAFDKSYIFYKKLVSLRSKMNIDDYINFIEMLFKARGKTQFDMIPQIIDEARFYYESLDFEYYLVLFKILKGEINQKDFNIALNKLSASNYSQERQLYLKTLFYNDRRSVLILYGEYLSLNDKKSVDNLYKKRVLYNILLKSKYLNDKEVLNLLNEWNKVGQNDIKTLDLLDDKRLYNFVNNNENLKKTYINYSGERKKDNDEDGEWEELFEYKNGVLVNLIFDQDQNGIYEKKIVNYDEGNMKEFYKFTDMNTYFKYYFNKYDNSVVYLESYTSDKLSSEITFINSLFYPKVEELEKVKLNDLMSYADSKEIWTKDDYKKIKYNKSIVEYIDVDSNNNKIFDKRELYKNGKLDTVLKDNNENGKYEVYEKYVEGKLDYITYISDEGVIDINYKEVFLKDGVQKYWDYDKNGKYEVSIIEYKDGAIKKLFDINFDGEFDFEIYMKNETLIEAYKILNNKKVNIQNMKVMEKKNNNSKNWTLISARDIKELLVPENIIVSDNNDLSGYYYYKGNQYFFKNGIIKNDGFSYKLSILEGKYFLFEE